MIDAGTKNDTDRESLLSALTMVTGKLHWAYVPDPSLIHPTVWPRSEILPVQRSKLTIL